MARIRTIKPEFWSDEKLAPLDPTTRLVFLGLISMADDAGRLQYNLKMIDAFIFPCSSHSAAKAVVALLDIGRIVCGETASGQRIIQIVNWRHQKIEKPNFAAALPPIKGMPDVPSRDRHSIPKLVREGIWAAAHGKCATCGVTCKPEKANKYDSDPTLGELDHIVSLADGGNDDASNLQLLCLRCNRRKQGAELTARNLRRVADDSTNSRGEVGDDSPTHINDLLSVSTISDQVPPKKAKRNGAGAPAPEWAVAVAAHWRVAVGITTDQRIAKYLGPVSHLGVDALKAAIDVYASPDEGPKGARKLEWFAENVMRWHGIASEPLVKNGVMTARGERVTRP